MGLVGFTDSNWVGSVLDQKSTSGWLQFGLGSGVMVQSEAKVHSIEFC